MTANDNGRQSEFGSDTGHVPEYWSPRTVGQVNNYEVMVVEIKGEFVWHKHDDTDDFFN